MTDFDIEATIPRRKAIKRRIRRFDRIIQDLGLSASGIIGAQEELRQDWASVLEVDDVPLPVLLAKANVNLGMVVGRLTKARDDLKNELLIMENR